MGWTTFTAPQELAFRLEYQQWSLAVSRPAIPLGEAARSCHNAQRL
jgi:hypothetical protein